jgi:hypothetical protein
MWKKTGKDYRQKAMLQRRLQDFNIKGNYARLYIWNEDLKLSVPEK